MYSLAYILSIIKPKGNNQNKVVVSLVLFTIKEYYSFNNGIDWLRFDSVTN